MLWRLGCVASHCCLWQCYGIWTRGTRIMMPRHSWCIASMLQWQPWCQVSLAQKANACHPSCDQECDGSMSSPSVIRKTVPRGSQNSEQCQRRQRFQHVELLSCATGAALNTHRYCIGQCGIHAFQCGIHVHQRIQCGIGDCQCGDDAFQCGVNAASTAHRRQGSRHTSADLHDTVQNVCMFCCWRLIDAGVQETHPPTYMIQSERCACFVAAKQDAISLHTPMRRRCISMWRQCRIGGSSTSGLKTRIRRPTWYNPKGVHSLLLTAHRRQGSRNTSADLHDTIRKVCMLCCCQTGCHITSHTLQMAMRWRWISMWRQCRIDGSSASRFTKHISRPTW